MRWFKCCHCKLGKDENSFLKDKARVKGAKVPNGVNYALV